MNTANNKRLKYFVGVGLFTPLLLFSFFLNSCGSCGKDPDTNGGTDESGSIETAILEGSLALSEIEKLMPPSTPLPDDITITSILTRSDIVTRSDYLLKSDLAESTTATLGNDETFTLEVPIGYEFITYVKMNDDVLGLIKFKKADKYVANITLSSDDENFLKGVKHESKNTYDIGSLIWYEDYFRAENPPSAMDESAEEYNTAPILMDNEIVEEKATVVLYIEDEKTINFEIIKVYELAEYEIINAPEFCLLTDNRDGTASLLCAPTDSDGGDYRGIILKITVGEKITILEIILEVKACEISVSAGQYHTCAIVKNCSLKCWGYNNYGQLGYGDTEIRGDEPGEMGEYLPYVNLGKDRKVESVCAGIGITCTLLDNNSVKCWGYNGYGAFGGLGLGDIITRGDEPNEMGDNLPALSFGNKGAIKLSCGGGRGCAILDDNSLACWGAPYGLYSSYYTNTSEDGDTPGVINLGTGKSALAVSVSNDVICAILNDNSVKCWGYNGDGQLGLGDTDYRGWENVASDMGDKLPAIDFGQAGTVESIFVTGNQSCAIFDSGNLKCWGENYYGYLGYGDTETRGDEPDEMSDNLPAIKLGLNKSVESIAGSSMHLCALLDDDSVKCWGAGGAWTGIGELGPDSGTIGDEESDMGESLKSVNLGTGRGAKAVSSSSTYVCAILDNDKIKCWGMNTEGELGYGDTDYRGYDLADMGDNLPYVDLGEDLSIVVE